MTSYQLAIAFDSDGLQTLAAADQCVTIVKSVRSGIPVSWLTFRPMLNNTVTWDETYAVYASTTQIEDGATIVTQSIQPAVGGNKYTLSGGQFDSGVTAYAPNMYGVFNNDGEFSVGPVTMITSGLYQAAAVNGMAQSGAVNAVAVPYLDTAIFTPIEKVQIFASSYHDNGMVISSVSSQALEVDLTEKTSQALRYNSATNQFAPM